MINHFQRSSTILAGGAIIVLAILRAFGAFTPSLLVTFCISMATLTYSLIDLLLELKKDTSKRIIISLDLVAIGFLILSFATEGISKIFDIDKLSTPSEIVTLLAFGIVILIIGIQDRKSISETIRSIESKSYIDKKKMYSTLDSDVAKQSMQELANYEYNTVFNMNKIILQLKKYDGYVKESNTVHNGWASFYDCLEYYRLVNEGPFYDHGLNNLFWKFDSQLANATSIFAHISEPQGSRRIAEILMFGDEIIVTRFSIGNEADEYAKAYQHIADALETWNELKSISHSKYEALVMRL